MWSAFDNARERRRLSALAPVLAARSRLLQAVRQFFVGREFIEVETPVRIPRPALELHIDAIASDGGYLRTSPELHMKRLLGAGYARIFQMGPCFRRGERGTLHNPEYTMLEWYRANAGYGDVLVDAEALVAFLANRHPGSARITFRGRAIDLSPPWERLSVESVFLRSAGWNPVESFDADRFDLDLIEKVEPQLPADRPVILIDYPKEAAALARLKPGDPRVAERWELYIGGVEMANAFGELTDAAEQRQRFEECAAARARLGKEVYPIDEAFLAALAVGLPPCAGVALGVDRLVMALTDSRSLDDVLPFREEPGQ